LLFFDNLSFRAGGKMGSAVVPKWYKRHLASANNPHVL
jgi:hypothetical protein